MSILGNKYSNKTGVIVLSIIIIATIVLILTIIYRLAPIPSGSGFIFWTSISLVTGLAFIRLPLGGGVTTSLGEIVDLAAFASVGPYPIVLANVGGAIGRSILLRRLDPIRDLFNLSQWNIASLVAYFIFRWINGTQTARFSLISLIAIFCAWFAYSIITTGFVSAVVASTERGSIKTVWTENYLQEFLVSFASAPLALVMAVLFIEYGIIPVLLLAIPLILLSVMVGFWIERTRMMERTDREKRLAEMGKAATTLLHELSRPFNRIVMISDFAISGGKPYKEALQEILDESLEADRLTGKLRRAFNLNLEKEPVVVGQLLDNLEGKIEMENIPVFIESEGLINGMEVYWDLELVITALLNLVKNAWESQNSEGPILNVKVISEFGPEESMLSSRPRFITFIVTDSGPGFPIDAGMDIFDALYSTKVQGLGIGLFLVNQITQAHGGSLRISNKDVGASISLSLPTSTTVS